MSEFRPHGNIVWNTHRSSIKPTNSSQYQQWRPRAAIPGFRSELMSLEILNGSFVFLCLCFRRERAEVSSLPGFRILLARIQPILPGFQFPDHAASSIRRRTGFRALDCRATLLLQSTDRLQRLSRTLKPECKQACENRQIGRQMRRITPVLTGVTETATGDIESAGFCRSRRQCEDNDQHGQDRQCPAIQQANNQREATQNLQPWQIKRQCDTNWPRKNFIVIDVAGELNRIECFDRSCIKENSSNDEADNAPNDVRCSMFDV